MAWRETAESNHPGFIGFVIHTVLRFFQFVLAIAVIGLYAFDIRNGLDNGVAPDGPLGRWVYAVVVGVLGAISALVLAVPFLKSYFVFPWDVVMFVLWTGLFGIFGSMYINEDPEGNEGIMRMRNAVWVDLTNMLLWFITALYGLVIFLLRRKHRSLHTGRATI